MSIIHSFTGLTGQLISSASVITVSLMMLFMSVRLRRTNRKDRAYRLLNSGLLLTLLYQAAALMLLMPQPDSRLSGISEVLRMLSFVIINFVVLELYCRPRRIDRFVMLLLVFLSTAAGALQFYAEGVFSSFTPVVPLPAMHFYGIIINIFFFTYILPKVSQQGKYAAGLTIYLIFQLLSAAPYYLEGDTPAMLSAALNLLPMGYYMLIFLLLFEWVIERLQSVYVSSIRDGLTGLYNRQYFMRKANRYKTRGLKVSILFCDIDNFKLLNDTRGHQIADETLKQVAAIIAEETQGLGTCGRYGGEELIAAIVHPTAKPAAIAEEIRRRVESETIVTVSIGCSSPGKDSTLDDALIQADEAMYRSKNSGKNKVTLFRSSGRAKAAHASSEITKDLSKL